MYCEYRFHRTPAHRTEGEPHAPHVRFQDTNVILLGAMHPGELRAYLEGPPMLVEVHDRDRKAEEGPRKPALFGDDPLDASLNLQSLVSPKDTENNPFASQNKTRDPHGVARVSFADLLLGHKCLNLAVPIHGCDLEPTHGGADGRSRRAAGLRVPTDGVPRGPMPAGNYIEAHSELKLRVDVAVPLRAAAPDLHPGGPQFGRIIFVFDVNKLVLLRGLLQDVAAINAKALGLDSCPAGTVRQILSACKTRVQIQERPQLDVLTGFHLLDGEVHLFVLEGVADQGLRRLWDSHQSR